MVLPNTRYTQCSGDDSSPSNVSTTTCMVEWNHIQTCHPGQNEMKWRDLPKQQILPYVGYFCNLGRFLHSADAAVGMTCRYVISFIQTGYICNVAGGRLPKKSWCDCHRQSIDFDSLRGAPPLRIHWKVIPFNHTGCICNVLWR